MSLLAFLFLVNLFTQPVQQATEILNEMQNAVAGWRRVIGIIDTPADVSDPGDEGVTLPRGPITVQFNEVGFAYPGGAPVLHDIDLTIAPRSRVAIVGETGSGKSTLAKLLTRLMDSSSGQVLLDGVDLRTIRFSSLRSRVVLVPQEGFLFDGTLLDNIRFGRPQASEQDVRLTLTEARPRPVGLDPAARAGHRRGPARRVALGRRAALVALARAYLADPDLLVLDEATSAVDPSTEVRIQRALDSLTRGRTSIAIAHRLSTAQAADEVIVVDAGRIVERGHHTEARPPRRRLLQGSTSRGSPSSRRSDRSYALSRSTSEAMVEATSSGSVTKHRCDPSRSATGQPWRSAKARSSPYVSPKARYALGPSTHPGGAVTSVSK